MIKLFVSIDFLWCHSNLENSLVLPLPVSPTPLPSLSSLIILHCQIFISNYILS